MLISKIYLSINFIKRNYCDLTRGGFRGWGDTDTWDICTTYTKLPTKPIFFRTSPFLQGYPVTVQVATSGFREGGERFPSPHGFDPLPTQRVPPMVLFKKSIFGRPTQKFFYRRLWCQYTLTLREGECAQKKRLFCGSFDLFFQKFACGAENSPKTPSFYCFRRARKINFVDLPKRSNFSNIF